MLFLFCGNYHSCRRQDFLPISKAVLHYRKPLIYIYYYYHLYLTTEFTRTTWDHYRICFRDFGRIVIDVFGAVATHGMSAQMNYFLSLSACLPGEGIANLSKNGQLIPVCG